ncbi:MULE transposase domain [Dillenia turbinata]|uniref:MULE transposase domain n=1 Tax=Dillenia turbinata TaxID=194707 RepID=A0AAN8W1S4_9MAGN
MRMSPYMALIFDYVCVSATPSNGLLTLPECGSLVGYGGSGIRSKQYSDDSLSYVGGEAHAVDITPDVHLDDLKMTLAEVCNLEYQSLFVKYFLPGNRRTLISLSTDKDLKRMIDFHGNSVTADIFVTGKESHASRLRSMNSQAVDAVIDLYLQLVTCVNTCRANGIKVAETVSRVATSSPDATTPAGVNENLATPAAPSADSSHAVTSTNPPSDSNIGVNAACSPIEMDMNATPADTVKKRRRTASWKVRANRPTIVAVTDIVEDKAQTPPRKKSTSTPVSAVEDVEPKKVAPKKDLRWPNLGGPSDPSPAKMAEAWKDEITGVGQDFKSVKEFREALQKYAIANRFVYKLIKNDTNRASGRCVGEGCSWRIHASWVPSEQAFRVKKMTDTHTCGGESRRTAHPTRNWIVSIIKDKLQENPHSKTKEIGKSIYKDFGVKLTYTQVWRGMEDARAQLQGSLKDAYNQLPHFCEKIVETNPGSVVKLVTNDEKRFERLFISFRASISGFQNGCRPLIFLDSTSLKSKYQEVLLVATAVDGNDAFFPLAFAVVDVEINDNWLWFLGLLKSALSNSPALTFVSDREKGLKKSILQEFENAQHGYSMIHLMESFKRNLKGPFYGDGKGALPDIFLAAAQVLRLDSFRKHTEHIKRVSPNTFDWVMQIEPEHWTNAMFKGELYNHIREDPADLYAEWIEEIRELPIVQKLEAIVHKMTKLMNARRQESSEFSTKLAPSKEEKLQQEIKRSSGLRVLFSSDTLFEVQGDLINVVNLDTMECSCLSWKATGMPCCHAIAVFSCTRRTPYDFCSKYFTADSIRSTYLQSITDVPGLGKPVPVDEKISDVLTVLPPSNSQTPCQQRNIMKSKKKTKRVIFCTRCKGAGHNKVTCKEALPLAWDPS